ncbi:uncharacterized protein LOC111077086 [Drosophila obscura]|uniref:uncharacterized protein LOC111077086 n=1 Tax=Drosophila obscura TaxID=7282 RepID=UPI001BB1BE71|nr:uncharacterized protein LOC111077086 [Drosophila obscura]
MATNLEDTLNKFNRELIKFDQHRQRYSEPYNELRDQLYSLWKRDEKILGKLVKGSTLEGSYGDNLKVSMPNEFDLVIHLVFPENDRIIVKPDPRRPGNVTLDMTKVMEAIRDKEPLKPIYEQLQKLVNGKNMLLEDKLQNWLTSLMTQTLKKIGNQIEVKKSISTLKYKRCGPAHTIFVDGPCQFSVDFVPGIKLTAAQSVLTGEQKQHFGRSTHWDAIPKPLKPAQPDNISFRASYYVAEHELIKDKGNLKSAVRLLKKFRDTKQNLGNLKSYYIKTVFLWEVTKRDRRYWQSPLNEIFIEMIGKLANALKVTSGNGQLPFFWDPKLDMIADLSSIQRAEMFNCVAKAEYRFRRGAGNLTDDIKDIMHSSFSNREERGIEKKGAKPKPSQISQMCEKKTVETQTECKPKPKANFLSDFATQLEIATANLQLGAKKKTNLSSLPGSDVKQKPKSKVAPQPQEVPKPNPNLNENKTVEKQCQSKPKPKENPVLNSTSEKEIVTPDPQVSAKKKASKGTTKPEANGSNKNLKPDVKSSSSCLIN